MRQALECCHRDRAVSVIIGVAGRARRSRRAPSSSSRAASGRGPRSEARGRTDVPKIVDWYMDGKIAIDPMITHTLSLEDINKGFELMHAGESIRSVVIY